MQKTQNKTALKWWKLRDNKCPKCEKDFMKHGSVTTITVSCSCGFHISMEKYRAIVNDLNYRSVQKDLDQMEAERENWE